MKRRHFFQKAGALSAGIGLGIHEGVQAEGRGVNYKKQPFAVGINDYKIEYHVPQLKQSVKIMHITDTHLWRDDERGAPYRQFSGRMAKAYNETRHFLTGETTHPEEAFEQTLNLAREAGADAITLTGDLFSFPSEAAIEWAYEKLNKLNIPYFYSSGNHDWHYEGMEGSLHELRNTWIEKRLLPLYKGNDPLMYAEMVKGINVVNIDNSYYEILPEQLNFFKQELKKGLPMVLMMHIPLYAPGRSLGYGCGHPEYKAANDKNFELERRQRWPEKGHSQTTMDFHKEVFGAENLLGIFAGHIHRQTVDWLNSTPQFLTQPNAAGGYLEIDFLPMKTADHKKFNG
ncbi:metallophosphoesterase [Cyclobacterium sp.]|uniref:metallophosphoesterase family protein n=1 Tax=Cyclobacterium sp. TaxID=1966343 RepID=UPI00198ADC0D|nr:metallophosphoesterase [Cyclobacterium sp.]MBD3627879.1 metallophosphoesterase [Cyclobacterium sp.]